VYFSYLQVEWDTKKKETDGARVFNKNSVRGSTVKVPQQNNFSDCGVFVLHYAESFFKVRMHLWWLVILSKKSQIIANRLPKLIIVPFETKNYVLVYHIFKKIELYA
jgi:Ulp1 family protease